MRRGFLVTVGVIVILAVIVFVWWLPAYREAEVQKQIAAIEAIEDLTVKKEAALNFLLENQMADREVLLRALDAAVEVHRESEDKQPLIDLFQDLYEKDLTRWLHYRIVARLDRGLVEQGTEESVARAEELAREMLEATDSPMETYHWMVYFHQSSDLTNPELTVRLALAAENAIDRDEYGVWPMLLGMAFTKLLTGISEEQGLAAALSKANMLRDEIENTEAMAALNAAVYSVSVDQDEGVATAAAQAMAGLDGLTTTDPMNRVAYDMAERGLAPEVAVELGRIALANASSRYDSTLVLHTVGWAYHAAGEFAEAAGYLKAAVGLMDETLTSDNTTVQHLLTAYDSGGMTDEAIDLLATIVARSVDADDPARAQLASKLRERDGSAAAMDELVLGLRYDGVETAPAFSLADRDGNMVSLESMKGDVLLLCFWSYG